MEHMQDVIRRYAASRFLMADARFRPPKWLVAAVDNGELDVKCLAIWKYVAAELGKHFDYGAATKYWRNKVRKMGFVIPDKFMDGGGGAGAAGRWKVKDGDQIEEWVKQTLKSAGLYDELRKVAYDWEMDINSLERKIEEAQEKIATHEAGIARNHNVKNRVKWLAKAREDLNEYQKLLTEAKKQLDLLIKEARRHEWHKSPTIEFEKEFQFMMNLCAKEFDKKAVLDAVKKALDRFEQDIDLLADEGPAYDANLYEPGYRTAGAWDTLVGLATRAWNFLVNAFKSFTQWVKGLVKMRSSLSQLMDSAGA